MRGENRGREGGRGKTERGKDRGRDREGEREVERERERRGGRVELTLGSVSIDRRPISNHFSMSQLMHYALHIYFLHCSSVSMVSVLDFDAAIFYSGT